MAAQKRLWFACRSACQGVTVSLIIRLCGNLANGLINDVNRNDERHLTTHNILPTRTRAKQHTWQESHPLSRTQMAIKDLHSKRWLAVNSLQSLKLTTFDIVKAVFKKPQCPFSTDSPLKKKQNNDQKWIIISKSSHSTLCYSGE